MKARYRFLPLLAIGAGFASAATNQYWNVSGTGGDGIWGTGPGDKNWNPTADGTVANTTWLDTGSEVAVFQDPLGGNVTVFGTVQTHGLSQTGANYTLDAGTITLVADATPTTPFVNVQSGTLTVHSVLAGNGGLAKPGPGTLVLSRANTFTGPTAIDAGTLDLTGSLASTSVRIASGAGLTDTNGGLASATVLTNAGTLTLGASDGVAGYISNGGTLAAGIGTLIVTSAGLNDGSSVAGNLNGPALTTNGAVSISGNTYCQTTNIASGTLTLTGTMGYDLLTIASGATLEDQSGGLLSRIHVTNAGTLAVNATQTIESYVQSSTGSLTGTAELTVSDNVTPGVGVTLNGGTVAGNLRGNAISTGDVLVSGTLGGGSLNVTGGTLTLTGNLLNPTVDIKSGATLLNKSGGLDPATVLTNHGLLSLVGGPPDTISRYVSNGGILGIGGLALTCDSATLNADSWIGGRLNTTVLTSSGSGVMIQGLVTADSTTVESGVLTISGALYSSSIGIVAGAKLEDNSSGLADTTNLSNAGTFTVNAADTIAGLTNNGGTVNGTGPLTVTGTTTFTGGTLAASLALTTTTALLNDGSTVAGRLDCTTLTTNGLVSITGSATAGSFGIAGGTLTNTGTLTATHLDISAGATLVAHGTQNHSLLTTSGPGPGTWQGNLTNTTTVAPGGEGVIGTLAVTGDFTNTYGGTLKLDLGTGVRDLVTVGGTATFGGTLDLSQLGPITPFVPVQVVAAGAYAGNFSTLTEDLDGAAWFNSANGSVTTLAQPVGGSGGALYGTTANQTATWLSLYDDVIDPTATNVTHTPAGGLVLTSGIADSGNPDLLNALTASLVPGGLNGAVLDRLSPEVYAGFQDYAIQATRSHQRAALDSPSLGFIQAPPCPHPTGSKNALPVPAANPWEYFAAIDFFDTATDSSPNGADYGLSGYGFIVGARTSLSERVRVGGYVAADTGSVDGALADADAAGWSLGLFAKALVHERTHTLVSGGLSYGKYSFDGTRGSLIATGGGWTPASVGYSGVDSDALELFLGVGSLIDQDHGFRLLPAAGLRYVSGAMDGFAETAGAAGSPIALVVGRDNYQHALAEFSVRAEADLTATVTLDGLLGVSVGLGGDDSAGVNARFASGSRPFRATAAGLDDDAVFFGLGANWRVRDNLAVGLHWRADFRSDADPENTVGLSTRVRF